MGVKVAVRAGEGRGPPRREISVLIPMSRYAAATPDIFGLKSHQSAISWYPPRVVTQHLPFDVFYHRQGCGRREDRSFSCSSDMKSTTALPLHVGRHSHDPPRHHQDVSFNLPSVCHHSMSFADHRDKWMQNEISYCWHSAPVTSNWISQMYLNISDLGTARRHDTNLEHFKWIQTSLFPALDDLNQKTTAFHHRLQPQSRINLSPSLSTNQAPWSTAKPSRS